MSAAPEPAASDAPAKKIHHMSEPLMAKFANFSTSPIVRFVIGPDQTTYHVHEELVFQSTDAFEDWFPEGEHEEGRENNTTLVNVDPTTFEVYVAWLYNGSQTPRLAQALTSPEHFAKLWMFAYQWDNPQLVDLATSKLKTYAYSLGALERNTWLGNGFIGTIRILPAHSKMLIWILHWATLNDSVLLRDARVLSNDTWIEAAKLMGSVTNSLVENLSGKRTTHSVILESCRYHHHEQSGGPKWSFCSTRAQMGDNRPLAILPEDPSQLGPDSAGTP